MKFRIALSALAELSYTGDMILTVQIRLLPDAAQADGLLATMRSFNAAANYAVGIAFNLGCTNKIELQKHVYRDVRSKFGIPADMTVRVIAQAVEALKVSKSTTKPVFRELASIPYSHGKNYSFKGIDRVSLQVAPSGRQIMPFVCGDYQRQHLRSKRGQANLIHRDGMFFLQVSIELPDADAVQVSGFIGVDLGIVEIATTDDGQSFSGKPVEKSRRRNARARKTYQRRGTRSARRRLRKMARRQSNFQRDVNHCISKKIVAKALAQSKGIAVEDLSGIRGRCEKTAGKTQRGRLSNWGFYQLRQFLTYKAKLAGIPLVAVEARYTSQDCSRCGHRDKANRKSQSEFVCKACGHALNADHNGALNIRSRALGASVNSPDLVAAPAS